MAREKEMADVTIKFIRALNEQDDESRPAFLERVTEVFIAKGYPKAKAENLTARLVEITEVYNSNPNMDYNFILNFMSDKRKVQ